MANAGLWIKHSLIKTPTRGEKYFSGETMSVPHQNQLRKVVTNQCRFKEPGCAISGLFPINLFLLFTFLPYKQLANGTSPGHGALLERPRAEVLVPRAHKHQRAHGMSAVAPAGLSCAVLCWAPSVPALRYLCISALRSLDGCIGVFPSLAPLSVIALCCVSPLGPLLCFGLVSGCVDMGKPARWPRACPAQIASAPSAWADLWSCRERNSSSFFPLLTHCWFFHTPTAVSVELCWLGLAALPVEQSWAACSPVGSLQLPLGQGDFSH